MALACGNVASYVDYIPPSSPLLTISLICDACVCPTTCFARWNGSKSGVRVKWFSCVFSFTLLSPTELLIFISSTQCYVVALVPQTSTVFTDKPYWWKKRKIWQNQYCFYNESLHSQSCDYPFSQKNIRPHLLIVWWCELQKTLLINSHGTLYDGCSFNLAAFYSGLRYLLAFLLWSFAICRLIQDMRWISCHIPDISGTMPRWDAASHGDSEMIFPLLNASILIKVCNIVFRFYLEVGAALNIN